MKILYFTAALFIVSLASCVKPVSEEPDSPGIPEGNRELAGFYVCYEGLFNNNNGSLAYYDFDSREWEKNVFERQNGRALGDTPNDLKIYGGKMYCVVNASNRVEVMDLQGKSLQAIPMTDENGKGRQPRYIAFHQDKAYVCNFDGTTARIDTASLTLEALVRCGKNPDGIAAANNKLYVSNSGGLDFPRYDNSVSVIDIESFTEIKKIEVAVNPSHIRVDSEGGVYVVSRGDYGDVSYVFQKIDSRTDELVRTFDDINPLNFTIANDTAYIYNYDFSQGTSWIKVFDCKTEQIINHAFISDGTPINTPYGIDVDPINGDVYVTDGYNFTIQGALYRFGRDGKLKQKWTEAGLNPNKTVFVERGGGSDEL